MINKIKKLCSYLGEISKSLLNTLELNKVHPIVFYASALLIGIAWETKSCSYFLLVLFIWSAFVIWRAYGYSFKFAFLLLVSFTAGTLRIHQQENKFANFWSLINNKKISIEATVSSREQNDEVVSIELSNIKILETNQKIPIPGTIKVYTRYGGNFLPDDLIRIYDLDLSSSKDNEQDLKFLLKSSVFYSAYIQVADARLLWRPNWSLKRWIYEKRESLNKRLQTKMDKQSYENFSSIFLGKQHVTDNAYQTKILFNQWGIAHYLARSGLHLVFLISILTILLNILPFSLKFKKIILLIATLTYSLLSWSSISFSRAIITFILYQICALFSLQIHTLYLFSLTLFLIILYQPFYIFGLDFQLSFLLTFGLAYLTDLKARQRL